MLVSTVCSSLCDHYEIIFTVNNTHTIPASYLQPITIQEHKCEADKPWIISRPPLSLIIPAGLLVGCAFSLILAILHRHRVCCKYNAEVDIAQSEGPQPLQRDIRMKSDIFFLCLSSNNKFHLLNEQVISWLSILGHKVIQLEDPVVQEQVTVNPEDWFFNILDNPGTKIIVVESEPIVSCDSLDSFKLFCLSQITARLAHNYNRLAVIQYQQIEPARLLPSLVPHTRLVLPLHCQELRSWLAE